VRQMGFLVRASRYTCLLTYLLEWIVYGWIVDGAAGANPFPRLAENAAPFTHV